MTVVVASALVVGVAVVSCVFCCCQQQHFCRQKHWGKRQESHEGCMGWQGWMIMGHGCGSSLHSLMGSCLHSLAACAETAACGWNSICGNCSSIAGSSRGCDQNVVDFSWVVVICSQWRSHWDDWVAVFQCVGILCVL